MDLYPSQILLSTYAYALRGGAGLKKWLILHTTVLIGCMKCRQEGEGVTNASFEKVLNGCPLLWLINQKHSKSKRKKKVKWWIPHQVKKQGVASEHLQYLEFPDGVISYKECQEVFGRINVKIDYAKQLCTLPPRKGIFYHLNNETFDIQPNTNILHYPRRNWLPGRFWRTPVSEGNRRGITMVSDRHRQLWQPGLCEVGWPHCLHKGVRICWLDLQ